MKRVEELVGFDPNDPPAHGPRTIIDVSPTRLPDEPGMIRRSLRLRSTDAAAWRLQGADRASDKSSGLKHSGCSCRARWIAASTAFARAYGSPFGIGVCAARCSIARTSSGNSFGPRLLLFMARAPTIERSPVPYMLADSGSVHRDRQARAEIDGDIPGGARCLVSRLGMEEDAPADEGARS
jgi:hypothetical protein